MNPELNKMMTTICEITSTCFNITWFSRCLKEQNKTVLLTETRNHNIINNNKVFVISKLIKVMVGVINLNLLITLTETLIILDITKPNQSNNIVNFPVPYD